MNENTLSSTTTNDALFSNSDHLEWNQKKHDMILNLGLTNTSETDQTPTPTRFIRNCEEVGLFQDLQNVNPFDEVFKKAVENPSLVNLHVPASTSDDTLHTPQIYPQLEENSSFINTTEHTANDCPLNSVVSNTDKGDDGENPLIIALEPETDNQPNNTYDKDCPSRPKISLSHADSTKDTREKIRAAIIQKSGSITPVPLDKLLDHEKPKTDDQQEVDVAALLRQREANRAAQDRCRKRKRKQFEDLEAENKHLKKENHKLRNINLCLHRTIEKLQEELEEVRSSNNSGPTKITSDERPFVNNQEPVVQVTGKTTPSDTVKIRTIVPTSITTVPKEVPLHNSQNISGQSPPKKVENLVSSRSKPFTQKKPMSRRKMSSVPLEPPLASKAVLLSLPIQNNSNIAIGIPVSNVHSSSNNVVIVCPQPSQVTVPSVVRNNFKKILPK